MAISLNKGERLSLGKEAPDLKKVLVGLGWDARSTDGADFDLDASAFLLNASGKVRSDADFIFYNQLKSTCGSVQHTGDNRTGEGEGDDEAIMVDLPRVPADVQKIAFTATIHEADARRQNFGQVGNAYIRLVNAETNAEVARYDGRGRLDRNGDDLRRTLPARRRVEVHRGRPWLCRRTGSHVPAIRHQHRLMRRFPFLFILG